MESVLAQTYENFEAILVDDGSTDASGKMCDEYAKKDARISVYHKPNGGLADARNYGVAHAKGEYIAFVDSDDYVTEDYIAYLYELLETSGAEISSGSYWRVTEDGKNKWTSFNLPDEEKMHLSAAEAIEKVCYGDGIGTTAWAKLFHKKLLQRHPFPFGKIYEDVFVIFKLISDSASVVVGGRCIYCYVQREGSIVRSGASEKTLHPLQAAREMLAFVQTHYPKAEQAAIIRCVLLTIDCMPQMLRNPAEGKVYFREYRRFLRPFTGRILKSKRASTGLKVRYFAIMLGYWPTQMVWKLAGFLHPMV